MLLDLIEDSVDYMATGGVVVIPLIVLSFWMWLAIFQRHWRIADYTGRMNLLVPPWVSSDDSETMGPGGWKELVNDNRYVSRWIQGEIQPLRENIGTIQVLAAAAPLLGLLGTVMGMISTFDVISYHGTSNAKALASGVSQALITTQLGLVVAVPGYFFGNHYANRVGRIEQRLMRMALRARKEASREPEPSLKNEEEPR